VCRNGYRPAKKIRCPPYKNVTYGRPLTESYRARSHIIPVSRRKFVFFRIKIFYLLVLPKQYDQTSQTRGGSHSSPTFCPVSYNMVFLSGDIALSYSKKKILRFLNAVAPLVVVAAADKVLKSGHF